METIILKKDIKLGEYLYFKHPNPPVKGYEFEAKRGEYVRKFKNGKIEFSTQDFGFIDNGDTFRGMPKAKIKRIFITIGDYNQKRDFISIYQCRRYKEAMAKEVWEVLVFEKRRIY